MELVIRATVIYWFLWLVTRGTGKRSLAEITPLDMVVIVVLGDFVQQGVTQEDMSVTGAVIVVSTFAGWSFLGDSIARRFGSAQRILDGEALIVIRDGVVLQDNLRMERLTIDDLRSAARQNGFANLRDIRLGVLEADGAFSFVGAASPGSTGPHADH